MNLLFVHIHHLLNEFRPHQARETLRVMMEMQKRQRLETAQRFQKHLEKVKEMVKTAFASLPDYMDSDNGQSQPIETTKNSTNDSDPDGCHPLDRLMCNIVDKM